VNAILQPPPDRRMVALAPLNTHMLGPTTEFADTVADLCEVFLDVLQRSIDELSDQLLASVQAGDLDDLYARAAPVPPGDLYRKWTRRRLLKTFVDAPRHPRSRRKRSSVPSCCRQPGGLARQWARGASERC
jgi:hypothetical protein